ncbi:MAG: tripartite tricarboxylate transporter TctB family protein [Pseudomonadota bacterium]
MTASRLQHVLSSSVILLVAAAVTTISFTQEPAAAFLFPRLISVVFIALAIWNFARATLGLAKVGEGLSWKDSLNLLPGLIIALAFVFFAAKQLGFYTASTIAFFAVYTIYDPAPLSSAIAWAKRITTTALFMAVMYGLFALLLKVQTPRGMYF